MDDMTSTQPNDRVTDQRGGVPDTATAVPGGSQTSAGAVASTVGDHATEMRDTVAEQAGQVAQDARAHASKLLDSSKQELRDQSEAQAAKVAEGLRSLRDQLGGMADGTPQAGALVDLTREAGERVGHLAERLDGEGIDGLVRDVSSMARRRPGTFLLGAMAAGFVAGRVLRTTQQVVSDSSSGSSGTLGSGRPSTAPGAALPVTPAVTPGIVTEAQPMPPSGYLDPSVAGATVTGAPRGR